MKSSIIRPNRYDIIVAGGGPAGVAAAVSAARAGASVLLLERHDCLGGVWTSGLLSYVFDFDKSDIGWEIIRRLDALGARHPDRTDAYPPDRDWVYEPEYMKFVCEEMCREARRIHGLYTVTKDDIERGATFPDAVTTSRFGVDIHGLDLKMNREKAAGNSGGVKFRPFQIPLRACVARDAGNLYMAGRCISGDFHAHASYRVTGSAVAIGEAVGKAAASAIRS